MGSVSPVGKLRNKITIQNTDLTADTHGGFTKANSTYVTAFANIKPKPAKQSFNETTGEKVTNPQDFEFIIRYRSGITTTMRILFGTRTFDIKSIEDDNEYNKYIKIVATENVGT
jgi:SPP1 family predicted phage head-tail adaptor|tara:strand:- start:178 stop:522 length:345 start_codon:yes stop_codon:yes gene_type:complete